ncbi:hypothetical protein [Roseovarius nanhaiticus]|uniref:hypothetical protein n=1 Tax=Roseovarius nanhaiticus TaxID=573024 RepID=UPI0024927A55|nr:hypothetical protein [Roseovarius nanhaiticus]
MSKTGKIALLGGALFCAALIAMIAAPKEREAPPVTEISSGEADLDRIMLLGGVDLDANAQVALLLHEMATGEGLRIVTDRSALKAAQGKAYYTDDPGAQTRLTLMSILFLSPPGTSPRVPMATLLVDGAEVAQYTCFSLHCSGEGQYGAHHRRDLAGLIAASRPATSKHVFFDTADAAWAAHDALAARADVVLAPRPEWPARGAPYLDHRIYMRPGAMLMPVGDDGAPPRIDEAAFEARFRAAFLDTFPQGDASYRFGRMQFDYLSNALGWRVVTPDGTPLTVGAEPVQLPGWGAAQPRVTLRATREMADRLTAAGALDALPEFGEEPPELAADIDALVARATGAPCPGCYRIEMDASAGRTTLSGVEQVQLYLPYYLIEMEAP